MIVYHMVFPNNKVYIGITSGTLSKRLSSHMHAATVKKLNTKLYRAIRKHKKFHIGIIYYGDNYEELKQIEKMFIKLYDSVNNGYNTTHGGDGMVGWHPNEKTKKLWSKQRKLDAPTRLLNANKKLAELRHPFIVYDINGNFIGEFNNQRYFAKQYNISFSYVNLCLRKNKQCKNFIIKYK